MNSFLRNLIVFAFVLFVSSSDNIRAKESVEESEEPSSTVGPGKAVEAASKSNGLRLSGRAIKGLDIQTMILAGGPGHFAVPAESLVFQLGETFIYRLKDGWFKIVEVRVVSRNNSTVVIRSKNLQTGDHIVSKNADLLRLAELEAWGGAIYACVD